MTELFRESLPPRPLLESGARKESSGLEGRCGWLSCRTSPFSYLLPSPKKYQ